MTIEQIKGELGVGTLELRPAMIKGESSTEWLATWCNGNKVIVAVDVAQVLGTSKNLYIKHKVHQGENGEFTTRIICDAQEAPSMVF